MMKIVCLRDYPLANSSREDIQMQINHGEKAILLRNNVRILDAAGPVLLYAHGFGCNQTMWDRITPAFRETHKQVLFDYVGSRKSDLSAFDPSRYSNLKGNPQDV